MVAHWMVWMVIYVFMWLRLPIRWPLHYRITVIFVNHLVISFGVLSDQEKVL